MEEFELSQHVAYGCETDTGIIVEPGEVIKIDIGCASSYPGSGHKHYYVNLYDENKNGKIDYEEYEKFVNDALVINGDEVMADNGVITGGGHWKNHKVSVYVAGKEIPSEGKPFTS